MHQLPASSFHRGVFRGACLVSLAVAAMLATGARASANAPLQEWKSFDTTVKATGASAICGFDIWRHVEGSAHFIVFRDSSGAIVREVDTFPALTNTIYAPSTGKSYTSVSPAVLRTYYTNGAAIGSEATAILTGLVEVYGDVGMDGGRLVFLARVVRFDAAGVPLIKGYATVSSVGPDVGMTTAQARCEAMR